MEELAVSKEEASVQSAIKNVLVVFFVSRRVVHHDYFAQGQTCNAKWHFRHLSENIWCKRQELWPYLLD